MKANRECKCHLWHVYYSLPPLLWKGNLSFTYKNNLGKLSAIYTSSDIYIGIYIEIFYPQIGSEVSFLVKVLFFPFVLFNWNSKTGTAKDQGCNRHHEITLHIRKLQVKKLNPFKGGGVESEEHPFSLWPSVVPAGGQLGCMSTWLGWPVIGP